MPGKSRHKRSKRTFQNKKRERSSQLTTLVQPPTIAQSNESVSSIEVPSPLTKTLTPKSKSAIIPRLNITAELRNIGILAGIMLIVLVVLSLILS